MNESLRQPKKLDVEDEESLAVIGHLIESSQDSAIRAEDFMNQIATEIQGSELRVQELESLGTDGAKKEMEFVKKMLILLRKNYEDALSRRKEAEQDVVGYLETRKHFIDNLKKKGS